jgi:hypothetical protein
MKFEKQKLLKRITSFIVCSTIALCAVFVVAQHNYTYSIKEVNESSILEGDEEPSSGSEDMDFIETLKNQVNAIIEDKKTADYEEYQKSLIVYDNLTMDELVEKLEKNLKSDLEGTGKLFAEYSIELGLDPYLAVSIVLLETGCNWECSQLLKQCNNVGGIKGGPGCFGGSYKKYESLEVGITSFLDLLYNNYYSKGLKTAEQINPKYAASTTWAAKVNKYIEQIKAS